MLRKYLRLLLNTDSASGLPSGPNGAGAKDPRAVLAEMVALRESPPAPEHEDSPPAEANPAPEEPESAPAQGEPGQEISAEQETPEGEEETAPEGETENEDSHSKPGEKALPESVQKRIDKLTAQKYQAQEALEAERAEKERLAAEVEELKAAGGGQKSDSPLPEAVAKLKTPAEVQARLGVVKEQVKALKKFLDLNPGQADTVHQIGDKQLTRAELVDWREALEAEQDALPQRSEQLTSAAQFTQQRKAMAAKIVAEFPQLADAEHPDTKMARQLLKDPRFSDVVEADYLALAMATGHRVLQAEKAKRTGGAAAPVKPLGSKVPLKPAAGGPRPEGRGRPPVNGENARQALDGIGKTGSRDSLAKLLEVTGR